MNPKRRSGLGVAIYLAAIILGTLLFITFSRMASSSATLVTAASGAGGAVAEELALSAVAEALWHFQVDGNDPSSPLFHKVRSLLETSTGPIDLSTDLAPTLLDTSLSHGPAPVVMKNATIVAFSAILRHPDHPRDLFVSCTVRLVLPTAVLVRTAQEVHPFGLDPIFPPEPLDQPTVALLHTEVLAIHATTLGTWLDAVVAMEGSRKRLQAFVEHVRAPRPRPPGDDGYSLMPVFLGAGPVPRLTAAEQAVLDGLFARDSWRQQERTLAADRGWNESDGWRERKDVERQQRTPLTFRVDREIELNQNLSRAAEQLQAVSLSPNSGLQELEAADSVVYTLAQEVSLDEWDPNARFAKAVKQSLEPYLQVAAQVHALNMEYQDTEADRLKLADGGLIRYVKRSAELFEQLAGGVQSGTQSLNTLCRTLLSETHSQFPELLERQPGPHPLVLTTVDQGSLTEFVQRTHGTNGYVHLVDAELLRRQGEAYAQETRGTAPSLPESPDGARMETVWAWTKETKGDALVPPKRRTISVSGWEGKALLDFDDSPIELKELGVADHGKDRLVLSAGRVEFSGSSVDASVLCTSAAFRSSTRIQGSLVVANHPAQRPEGKLAALSGTVVHDERTIAGQYQDAAHHAPEWARVNDSSTVLMLNPRSWDRRIIKGQAP